MVAERGPNSLIGRDWLNAFNYKFVSPTQNEGKRIICKVMNGTTKPKPIKFAEPGETINSENWKNHQNEQLKVKQQFKELFERQEGLNKLSKMKCKSNLNKTPK